MNIDLDWLKGEFPHLSQLASLNSGAFKSVFSANHSAWGEIVLKIIQPTQDIEDVRREILAVQSVQADRVPKILDYGQLPTNIGICFYLIEERIFGSTVRECLQAGSLGELKTLRLGLHILESLVKAEEVQIVHRDVKPENIICDPNDNFFLIDFGIARHLQLDSRTDTSNIFGKFTPGYGPPEQFRNIKPSIDSRSDLFALGITIFECVSGQNPFRDGAANVLEILRRVEQQPLPQLSLSVSTANEFRDLVIAMTQKRPDQRPPSARYSLEWIQEICAQEDIS